MRALYVITLSFILLIGGSCTGSKSYSKKAKKMQEAGLNEEAAAFYLVALQRNPKNVDAKIGLKVTGQIQIEKSLTSFYKAYSLSNYKEAVYTYQEALNYKHQYERYVSVEIPPYYNDYYQEMLGVYLEDRYKTAGDFLYEENFKEASLIYSEILKLNAEYKDVKELSLQSVIEPLYRSGITAFQADKFRKCYDIMSQVLSKKAMYKDAVDYKERALEEGQVTVAVMDFQSVKQGKSNITEIIQANVVAGLIRVNDPFIKVLDRSNTDVLIKEQKINVNESSIGSAAIKTGELLGANILIRGKLITYTYSGGVVKGEVKQGFESYKVKKVNPETKKTYYQKYYKRVKYTEFTGGASVFSEVQYQMISAETGQVLKSDVFRNSKSDYVNYISFSGNDKFLYDGKISEANELTKLSNGSYASISNRVSLKRKARQTKRTLLPESQLRRDVLANITDNIVYRIANYNLDDQ